MSIIENMEAMLTQGQDNALLRFSLGQAYYKDKNYTRAIEHLAAAVRHDPAYSAAWKIYGRALAENHDTEAAISAFEQGIQVAEARGDKQAAKEMQVFLKRLLK
jgi:uncharacterized protein HemY